MWLVLLLQRSVTHSQYRHGELLTAGAPVRSRNERVAYENRAYVTSLSTFPTPEGARIGGACRGRCRPQGLFPVEVKVVGSVFSVTLKRENNSSIRPTALIKSIRVGGLSKDEEWPIFVGCSFIRSRATNCYSFAFYSKNLARQNL